MLLIIVSIINYFHSIEAEAGYKRLFLGFKKALNNLGGNKDQGLIVEKDVMVSAGVYSAGMFAEAFNIDDTCIKIQAPKTELFEELVPEKSIKVIRDCRMNVYFQCIVGNICEKECIVSFNKKPDWS